MAPNVETMAYFGKAPWWVGIHNGTARSLDGLADKAEILAAAGMDWNVDKSPLYLPNGAPVGTGHVALTRSDTGAALAVVKSTYLPIQNEEVLATMDDVLDDSGAKYETAGVLGGGRLVWALARLPESVQINGDPSETKMYLLGFAGHDGRHGFTLKPTPIRVVCQNTANAALDGDEAQYVIRHTRYADRRIGEIRRALRLSFAYNESWVDTMNRLAGESMTTRAFAAFAEKLVPVKADPNDPDQVQDNRARTALADLWHSSATLTGVDQNKYRAFQVVAEYADHVRPFRSSRNATMLDNRAMSILTGNSARMKDRALALLTK